MRDQYEPQDTFIANPHQLNTQLLYITHSRYGIDWISEMHSHHFTEIFYILNGKGSFHVQEVSHTLVKDDIVIVNSYVEHTEKGNSEEPLEYIVIGLSGLEFTFNKKSDSRYAIFNARETNGNLLYFFENMLSEMKSQSTNYGMVCQRLLDILLVKLNRELNSSVIQTDRKFFSKESHIVKLYIDEHYRENITLDTLAEIAHINKYYVVHSFKRAKGMSPINYLNKKRILESKNLLLNTDHTLTQISTSLGFSSPSYFSQSFKRIVNMSPNEYRRNNKLKA